MITPLLFLRLLCAAQAEFADRQVSVGGELGRSRPAAQLAWRSVPAFAEALV